MEIQEAFKALNESKVQYCCIEGYQQHWQATVYHLLTTDVDSIIRLLELKRVGAAHKFNPYYRLEIGTPVQSQKTLGDKILDFYVYAKGNGLFNDRFESLILSRRVIQENIIYVPDYETRLSMTLYNMSLGRSGSVLSLNDSQVIKSYITQKFGESIPKCKYDVKF